MLTFICFASGNDWLGYWGKHMKANCFKAVREYQKVRKSNETNLIGISWTPSVTHLPA